MSNDLISRKAVLEILYDISDRNYGSFFGHGINKACDVIEHAETAFDKEKVIEHIKNERDKSKEYNQESAMIAHEIDIEIVKKGGIE